jgi:hypothetical protein
MRLALITLVFLVGTDDTPLSMVGKVQLDCPVCGQAFDSLVCTQTNNRGGVDRDLFARAIGPQPEFYRISTCPQCGYSGYPPDFDPQVNLPPDFRARVLEAPGLGLPEGFTPESDPRELSAIKRYELAIRCYRWRQKPDEALAWLNMRASWVARDTGSILPPTDRLARVMKFLERWRPPMRAEDNQADLEMQTATRISEALVSGRFNRHQVPFMELALALVLRRHGENRLAEPLLNGVTDKSRWPAGAEPLTPLLQDGIRRMRVTMRQERAYQQEAARYFERALLSGQIAEENRGPALYLLGELSRRLGRDEQAVSWFDKALAPGGLSQENRALRTWAKNQRAWAMAEAVRVSGDP